MGSSTVNGIHTSFHRIESLLDRNDRRVVVVVKVQDNTVASD